MNLTHEQKEIINSKEKSFKINAVAGSGKTTTLLEYAKKHPNIKILYLAYNKSLQTSLQKKLHEYKLNNMNVSTIHALAYNKTAAYQYNLCHEIKTYTIEKVLINYERLVNNKSNYYPILEYITLIKDLINFYCNSSLIALDEDLLNSYVKNTSLGAKILELLNKDRKKALAHLKYCLSSMKNKQIDASHDFYLKMFYLNKKLLSTINYDLILVDEAQDISDVMIGIVESLNARRIYVGDSFQQIYSFRYATNALNKIDLPSYNLSKSFRFSNTYAKILEEKLNTLYDLNASKKLEIFGNDGNTLYKNDLDLSKQTAIIARTSFGLIQELVYYLHKDYKIYFEGGYSSYSFMNQTVYSIFYLKQKKHDKISIEELKEFETIKELEEFAKETKNQDYINIIKFINTYGDNIFEINKKVKTKIVENKKDANLIFTTAHKAKGLEYEQVLLADDFISKKEILNSKTLSFSKINEEINILYVAATRVKKAIKLPNLNLSYKKTADDYIEKKPIKKYKKTSDKKMKSLQEQWLKNNNIKKIDAF